MNGAFDDIKLEWDGVEYVIRSKNVMRAIARIEDVVTLQELSQYAARGTAPIAKIALAYAAVLEFAGCNASSTDVYSKMFEEAAQQNIAASIQALLMMMLPPDMKKAVAAAGKPQPTPQQEVKQANAARTSKKRSKRQSAKANGAQPVNSGI